MSEPLVSVITITFNLIKNKRQETFAQCLKSVRSQTYGSIEHIVVDGGSQDGTLDLIERYQKKGWLQYISEPDDGIYDAMNKGAALAKGKYVAFLNSDDYYHDNEGIQRSVSALEKSKAAFSYAPVVMKTEHNKPITVKHPHMDPDIRYVYFVMPFCHQSMLVRRDVLLKEDKFDDDFRSAGDYDFVLRLCLKNYTSVKIDKAFTTFRFGGISDANQQQSVDEVAKSYYKNYKKICKISRQECRQIYCQDYNGITIPLAFALKDNKYFDFDDYVRKMEELRKHLSYLRMAVKDRDEELKKVHDSKFWKLAMGMKRAYLLLTLQS